MASPTPPSRPSRRTLVFAVVVGSLVLFAGAIALAVALATPSSAPVAEESITITPTPTATPWSTPTPTPTETGPAADTATYDLEALPDTDVFSVNPAIGLDDDPGAATTGMVAQPVEGGAPVFAEPGGAPVARLAHTQTYEGTVVPVAESYTHWVKVLLPGRQGIPPEGNSAQTIGWMRTSDVTLSALDAYVEVDLTARTIDIVTDEGSERVADDFGSGASSTPTPTGRAFIMMVRTAPEFAYTRGHPLVYLSVQSPTLGGFGGAAVAVTAFHYHDAHSGAISNGCLRLGAEQIDRLAQLPPGTPVYISS